MEFFQCKKCKNVAIKLSDSDTPLSCCGAEMKLMRAGSVDAAQEKHVPVVTVEGRIVRACVGEVMHPMTDTHSIEWVVLKTNKGIKIHNFSPDVEPETDFALTEDESPITVYEYCNLHGIWKTDL